MFHTKRLSLLISQQKKPSSLPVNYFTGLSKVRTPPPMVPSTMPAVLFLKHGTPFGRLGMLPLPLPKPKPRMRFKKRPRPMYVYSIYQSHTFPSRFLQARGKYYPSPVLITNETNSEAEPSVPDGDIVMSAEPAKVCYVFYPYLFI